MSALWHAVLAGSLLLAANLAAAADGGFSSQLSPEELVASGLSRLTPAERMAIDQIVAAETSESRLAEGRVLSGTFAHRRTAAETQETGIGRLTADELARLNELVAAAAVDRPTPRERPRIHDDSVLLARRKPEVHGSLSFTYGQTKGGGSFRGTDLWLTYSLPDLGLTLGVGMSRYSGVPLYYSPAQYGPRYLHRDPFLLDPANRALFGEDLAYGTGESFSLANSWGSLSYSQRHN